MSGDGHWGGGPVELLGMAEEVEAALGEFREGLAGMVHLVAALSESPVRVRSSQWPAPGPAKAVWLPPPPKEGGVALDEVVDYWQRGGRSWLRNASRPEVRALSAAARDTRLGPGLIRDPALLEGLRERLRPGRWVSLLNGATFVLASPPDALRAAARTVPASRPLPAWWVDSRWPHVGEAEVKRWLGQRVLTGELRAPGDLDLPESAWASGWVEAIVAAARPSDLESVRRQLAFAKGGELNRGALVTPAVAQAIRNGIELATASPVIRRDVAVLGKEHIGTPFGAAAEADWRLLSELLPRVRAWLAGEVLGIVFEHLTPPNTDVAHMTRPRKVFWQRYTGSVVRMWVAVTSSIRPQLAHPDLDRLRETMGSSLQIRGLEGVRDQAIVWMHLEGAAGPVTVVEGNANTSLRIRQGLHSPRGRTIDYSGEVVHRCFSRHAAFVTPHDQAGRWRDKAHAELRRLGIRRDPR